MKVNDEAAEGKNDSQSSWEFVKNFKSSPKVATLIQERIDYHLPNSPSVYTYHKQLNLFDNQSTFNE